MLEQLTLGEAERRKANLKAWGNRGRRGQLFRFLVRRGATGATDEECRLTLHINPSTERFLRRQLEQMGLITWLWGIQRRNRSGRLAPVWITAEEKEKNLPKYL